MEIIYLPLCVPENEDKIIAVKVLYKLIKYWGKGRYHFPGPQPWSWARLSPFIKLPPFFPPFSQPSIWCFFSPASKASYLFCLLWGTLTLLEFIFLVNLTKRKTQIWSNNAMTWLESYRYFNHPDAQNLDSYTENKMSPAFWFGLFCNTMLCCYNQDTANKPRYFSTNSPRVLSISFIRCLLP